MKYFLSIYLFIVSCTLVYSAKVDTVSIYSPSMDKEVKAIIITPDSYPDIKELPTVYLLHGHSGNYRDYIQNIPDLGEYADRFSMIFVCPDGNYNSWYFDSPEKPESKYETFISKELVSWVDRNYKTYTRREGRAITGLSMGGHGALYLAFKHQQVFSSAGSMSGGVDLRPFPNNWQISEYLGSYSENPERWNQNSVINLTHLLTPNSLNLIIECGTEDFFYEVNLKLHKKLLYKNIPHTFISSPGGHTWDFWRNAIRYQLEFFNSHFQLLKKN